jgi:hypothetical protein
LGTEQFIEGVFGKKNIYGPVMRWPVKIYGRDVSYSSPSHIAEAAARLLAVLQEDFGGAVALQAGYFVPTAASLEKFNLGKIILVPELLNLS